MIACLSEQRGLLISGRARDPDGSTEQRRICLPINAAGRHWHGQHAFGNVQLRKDLIVPLQGVDIEKHRARGVGIVRHVYLSAGQLPDDPRLHCAEQQLAALGTFPHAGNIFKDPAELRPGEICVNDKPGLPPEHVGQPPGLQTVAVFACPAALPDDRVTHRLAGVLIPDDRRLALVGDADRRNIRCGRADLLHCLDGHT